MTTYDWQTTRAKAIATLGPELWPDTEQNVVEHFIADPQRVVLAIDQLANELAKGRTIRAPWAVLRKRLSTPPLNATVEDNPETRIRQALLELARIRHEFDSLQHALDYYLDERGTLNAYTNDESVRRRLAATYGGGR